MKICFLWFHEWSKWKETDRGMATYEDAFGRKGNMNVIVMRRECARCGFIQIKRSKT